MSPGRTAGPAGGPDGLENHTASWAVRAAGAVPFLSIFKEILLENGQIYLENLLGKLPEHLEGS